MWHASSNWLQFSPESREACRHFPPVSPKLPVSPWKKHVHTSTPQLLWQPLEGWIPRSPGSDSQWCLRSEVPQDWNKQTRNSWQAQKLNLIPHITAIHPCPVQRGQAKISTSQFLFGRDLTTYIPSCCLRVRVPTGLYLMLTVTLPFGELAHHQVLEPLRTRMAA